MAAGRLPAPGTQYGPCVPTCEHTDCACTRRMAETQCALCDDVIGYDRRFYDGRDKAGLVHASCAESV
jgi:hypothetical protein